MEFKEATDKFYEYEKDTLDFFFKQAEKNLIEVIETDKLITDRAYRGLGIVSPIIIAISAYTISVIFKQTFTYVELTLSINGLIAIRFLFECAYYFYNIIKPKPVHYNGSAPNYLLTNNEVLEYKTDKNNKDLQYKYALIWELKNYQVRIDENNAKNSERINIFEKALRTIKLLFIWCFFASIALLTLSQIIVLWKYIQK